MLPRLDLSEKSSLIVVNGIFILAKSSLIRATDPIPLEVFDPNQAILDKAICVDMIVQLSM